MRHASVATSNRSNQEAHGTHAPAPGKRTLTQALAPRPAAARPAPAGPAPAAKAAPTPLQALAAHDDVFALHLGGATPAASPQAVAREGLAGAPSTLPHLDQIQSSFGHHDVRATQSFVGGPAATASQQLGAHAYATDGAVAFAASPDLHTAAHEAAHVVQQRAGVQLRDGLGRPADDHERHADAVADRVAAGQSAVDRLAAHEGGGGGGVQLSADPDAAASDEAAPAAASDEAAPSADADDEADEANDGGGGSLEELDPELAADVDKALATADQVIGGASILQLVPGAAPAKDLANLKGLLGQLRAALAALAATDPEASDDEFLGQIDDIDALQVQVGFATQLVDSECHLYQIKGVAGALAVLGPMLAAERALADRTKAAQTAVDTISKQLDAHRRNLTAALKTIQDETVKAFLTSLLDKVTGPMSELVGSGNLLGQLAVTVAGFGGGQLITQAVDGKAEWTSAELVSLQKSSQETTLKWLIEMEQVPQWAGTIVDSVNAAKSSMEMMQKLTAASDQASAAIDGIQTLSLELLRGTGHQKLALSADEARKFQQEMQPVLAAVAACAPEAQTWQEHIAADRAALAEASGGE